MIDGVIRFGAVVEVDQRRVDLLHAVLEVVAQVDERGGALHAGENAFTRGLRCRGGRGGVAGITSVIGLVVAAANGHETHGHQERSTSS